MTLVLRHVVIMTTASLLGREVCSAQSQPENIPTVVAQALNAYEEMLGKTTYVVGRAPAGWPKELTPARTRIIGGGTIGSIDMFHMRTLVVEFPVGTNAGDAVNALAVSAGYARSPGDGASRGGFVDSPTKANAAKLCKGSSRLLTFRTVDSVAAPHIIALHYTDGEMARQNCDAAEQSRMMSRRGANPYGPRNMPTVAAPRGVAATQIGSNWSGSSGETRTMLRTTMPVDSILLHYTTQLVAAGWKTDGSLLANSSVGIQKFSFRDGEEPWSAALIIMAVGDRRDMGLRLSKVNSEY